MLAKTGAGKSTLNAIKAARLCIVGRNSLFGSI